MNIIGNVNRIKLEELDYEEIKENIKKVMEQFKIMVANFKAGLKK